MSNPSKNTSLRTKATAALASILAVGAGVVPTTQQQVRSTAIAALAATSNTTDSAKRTTAPAPTRGGAQIVAMIRGMGGDPLALLGLGGNRPADWGRSAACTRMVRKNRLRAAGLGGQRI